MVHPMKELASDRVCLYSCGFCLKATFNWFITMYFINLKYYFYILNLSTLFILKYFKSHIITRFPSKNVTDSCCALRFLHLFSFRLLIELPHWAKMLTSFPSSRTYALWNAAVTTESFIQTEEHQATVAICSESKPCNFAFVVWCCHCYIKPEHRERSHAVVINVSSVINPISCSAPWTLSFPLRSSEDLASKK